MENYSLLQRLGKGAQGSVYLAINKIDNKKYVLKKVECNDESEANKAFQEAMALYELKHPYICGYKEFFVTWDKEECAMFVCIIMEYYENGDLEKVLRDKRQKKEEMEELMIKKWLGQAIEALVFIHSRKVIHRDLKPSNVFITDEMNITLGDFGVATIMGDIRTQTRTAVGSMNWMAPEVMERPYDERSDVWSLGCIILEMMTCHVVSSNDMAMKLFELKSDPSVIDQLIELAENAGSQQEEVYSLELRNLVREMLRRNFEQRPTATELADRPYIKECLQLSGSALADRQKKLEANTTKNPIPFDQGANAVVDYIKKNLNNENCVKEALEWLTDVVKDSGLTQEQKLVIASAVKNNAISVEICIAGCNIFSHLIINASPGDTIFSDEVLSTVLLAMKSHVKSSQLQQSAAALLMAFSGNEKCSLYIGQHGGIQSILEAVRSFPKNSELFAVSCNALWSLCVNENNSQIATAEQALRIVCEGMRAHSEVPEAQENGAAALLSLSMEDENIDRAADLDIIRLLLLATKDHVGHAKLVKNCCMAMSSFVETDEESALKLLDNEVSGQPTVQGMSILAAAFDLHKDNIEVVEAIATLVNEVVQYEDLCYEVTTSEMPSKLQAMRKMYLKTESVTKPVEIALEKLGISKVGGRTN